MLRIRGRAAPEGVQLQKALNSRIVSYSIRIQSLSKSSPGCLASSCSRSLFNSYAKLTQSSHCCRCKPLVLLRFYKVFDAKWCISLGFDRFGMRNDIFPEALIGLGCLLEASRASEVLLFIIKSMLWEAFRSSQRPEGHQSFQTITFHYQSMLCESEKRWKGRSLRGVRPI